MGRRFGVLFTVVLVVLFDFSTGEAADIRADTVLYYGFDGTEGNNLPGSLLDDTGTYTATIIAGSDPDSAIRYAAANPTYNPSGTSAEFYNDNWGNYAGDTFLIPDSGGIDFSSFREFTAELFIYADPAGSGQYRRIFSEYIYAYMYLDPGNTLHAVRKWGGGAWNENRTLLSRPGFPLDEWFHVAMTWDADAVGDKFKLYVDGELTGSAAGTSTPTIDSSAGFTIGGYQREDNSTAQFFRGKIDEFRLSDAALEPVDFVGAPPSISFSTASSGGVEDLSPARVAVILKNAEQGQTYSVDYSVIGGTAVPGVDYALVTPCDCDLNQSGGVDFGDIGVLAGEWLSQTPGSPADVTDDNSVDFADFSVCALEWFLCDIDTLQFGPGQTARMICLDVFDDHVSEGEETIGLRLSGATGPNVELGPITEHTYTIFEVVPQVSFAADTGSVGESDTTVMVAVTLSHAGSETITVDYSVTGGTATGEGVDYSLADGTLLFAPGQTITHISIEI
ncbi:MAG: LamG-like jellyroll fold domain-containing protein, partial [Planctomycetota bacterium]